MIVVLVAMTALPPPLSTGAAGPVIYVDGAAMGANDGTSWEDAFTDLQTALGVAPSPSEIRVAAGVYRPTTGSDRSISFVLKSGVEVHADGQGVTVLSGDIGFGGDASDNSYHVVTAGAVDSTAVLDGFVIAGGNANGSAPNDGGGGILITSGSPTLSGLSFISDTAAKGGAIYNDSGSPKITDTFFLGTSASTGGGLYNATGNPSLKRVFLVGNSAMLGGGLYNLSGLPTLADVQFSSNSANIGGGLYNASGNPDLSRVSFSANTARANGGGVYNDSGSPSLTNVTFSNNSASGNGGGLYNNTGGPNLGNVTFARNRAASSGGGLYNLAGTANVDQSILWANVPQQVFENPAGAAAVLQRNLVQGGCPAGTTCTPSEILTADPLLDSLSSNGAFTPTHALGTGSPAIDAGNNPACAAVDQREIARPVDGNKDGTATCDLGAFEFVPDEPVVAFAAASSAGNESVTTVDIPVSLSTTAVKTVTVNYAVTGGTATAGGDYALSAGTLSFPPLTTTRNIVMTVVNDRFHESNETVQITLSGITNATLGSAVTHTYRITDDDPRVLCRGRVPTIVGTAGPDVLRGTPGVDVIVGLGGNDRIDGRGGDDVICGGDGNDTIRGGGGNDVLVGESGDDVLIGEAGDDQLRGGGGGDRLRGDTGVDLCRGDAGKDNLFSKHGCEIVASVP